MAGKSLIRGYRLQNTKQVVGINPGLITAADPDGSAAIPGSDDAVGAQTAETPQQQEELAGQIVEAARQEAEDIRQQAQEDGYRQGCEEGRHAGEQTGESVIAAEVQRIREIAESAQAGRLRLLASLEGEVVELVLAVARKVIGDELLQNPETIANIVRQAATQIANAGPLRVRLHPHDVERLGGHWSQGDNPNSDEGEWELVSDERLSPGSCIIEAGAGTVDARIETQMDEIANAFRETAGTA